MNVAVGPACHYLSLEFSDEAGLGSLTHDSHNLPSWTIPSIDLACIHAEDRCNKRERQLCQKRQPQPAPKREGTYEDNRDNREYQQYSPLLSSFFRFLARCICFNYTGLLLFKVEKIAQLHLLVQEIESVVTLSYRFVHSACLIAQAVNVPFSVLK